MNIDYVMVSQVARTYANHIVRTGEYLTGENIALTLSTIYLLLGMDVKVHNWSYVRDGEREEVHFDAIVDGHPEVLKPKIVR